MQVASLPSGRSNTSASECAGSVDSTSVRRPASAHASAVAAATVVLPTPPLPVNSRILIGSPSPADPRLEILQRGADDAAFGSTLHEPRDRKAELDGQVVRHLCVTVAGGLEHIAAVEPRGDVARHLHPRQ